VSCALTSTALIRVNGVSSYDGGTSNDDIVRDGLDRRSRLVGEVLVPSTNCVGTLRGIYFHVYGTDWRLLMAASNCEITSLANFAHS
jgi:hypothetical protein